jgi:restriction system protein
MRDLNPWERRFFDWLSRRSDFALAAFPVAVFVGFGLLGLVSISVLAHRSPDSYVIWAIAWVAIAAMTLYVASFYSAAATFLRSRRFKLLELHQTMRDIQAMSWREFEDLVAASYTARGYSIEPRGGDSPDGGVDLVVRKDNLTWLVQCKHYRSQWIEERPLRELLGVVTAQGAAGGVLVACGVFDDKAMAFARRNAKLELIGGEQLRDLVAAAVRYRDSQISCPSCGSQMREKTGRFGPFLGCSNFPACRGWLEIPSAVKAAPKRL